MKENVRVKKVFQVTITGKEKERIFTTEIHKKKLLDALAEETKGIMEICGYCILDEECIFLAICTESGNQEESIRKMVQNCMYHYKEKLLEQDFDRNDLKEWKISIRECEGEMVWQELLRLHFLPVKHSYTVWPEDYWWSSYQEYLGRNWMSFQKLETNLTVKEIRKEHREYKKQHPEIYRRTST